MKQTTQWIAALFMVASTGLAFGCGCSSEKVRLEPVRERMIKQTVCTVEQPVLIRHTGYVSQCPSELWSLPTRANPPYVISQVYTPRFRSYVGAPLNEPEYVGSFGDLEPIGERITTTSNLCNPCGMRQQVTKTITLRRATMLTPVGEKIIRVRYLKMTPVLQPVGERTTIRTTRTYVRPWSACD